MQTATSPSAHISLSIRPVNGAKSPMVMYQGCALLLVSANPQDARAKPTIIWRSTEEITVNGRTMAQVIRRADDPHDNVYQWYLGSVLIENAA